jgi:hypothetical protein
VTVGVELRFGGPAGLVDVGWMITELRTWKLEVGIVADVDEAAVLITVYPADLGLVR